jgi:hypothetical protein
MAENLFMLPCVDLHQLAFCLRQLAKESPPKRAAEEDDEAHARALHRPYRDRTLADIFLTAGSTVSSRAA